jgi:hypothetical protein
MPQASKKAKVTPETQEEAKRLSELWATRSHPSQAEFGETYGIGNQSAVGQSLRGDTPLSLKAASGFAKGLGCRIEDFSPRLAAEASSIASVSTENRLLPSVAEVAARINTLPPRQRDLILNVASAMLNDYDVLQRERAANGLSPAPTPAPASQDQPQRRVKGSR